MRGIVADNFLASNNFWAVTPRNSLTPLTPVSIIDTGRDTRVLGKVGPYVWFHRHARADHHFSDRSDYLRPAKTTRTGQVARQEPRGIQEGLKRAEVHAGRGNPDRRAAFERGGLKSHLGTGGSHADPSPSPSGCSGGDRRHRRLRRGRGRA